MTASSYGTFTFTGEQYHWNFWAILTILMTTLLILVVVVQTLLYTSFQWKSFHHCSIRFFFLIPLLTMQQLKSSAKSADNMIFGCWSIYSLYAKMFFYISSTPTSYQRSFLKFVILYVLLYPKVDPSYNCAKISVWYIEFNYIRLAHCVWTK